MDSYDVEALDVILNMSKADLIKFKSAARILAGVGMDRAQIYRLLIGAHVARVQGRIITADRRRAS
jgi:hypothetical protein